MYRLFTFISIVSPRMSRTTKVNDQMLLILSTVLSMAVICCKCWAVWPQVDKSSLDFVRQYVESALNSAPPLSVIFVHVSISDGLVVAHRQ